jgi:hypothetical protein
MVSLNILHWYYFHTYNIRVTERNHKKMKHIALVSPKVLAMINISNVS